jgi:hypothetical protein
MSASPDSKSTNNHVLPYGLARPRRRAISIAVLLTAVVLPASWLVRPKLVQLYSEHQQRKEIRYQIQSNLDIARSEITQQRWSNAQLSIDRARLAACADPTIFTIGDIRQFRDRIEEVELNQEQGQENYSKHHPAEISGYRRQGVICQSSNAIADMNRTSDELVSQMRGVEAVEVIDQILILDPGNAHAQDLRVFVTAYFDPASSPTKFP